MNNKEFQLIRQYFGSTLLNYTLNTNQISHNNSFDKITLSDVQINILDDMYLRIKALRIKHIEQNGFGDFLSTYLHIRLDNNFIPFNEYREKCGGNFPEYEGKDEIVRFLNKICVREYPYLLIKSSLSSFSQSKQINVSFEEMLEIVNLIKSDSLDKCSNEEDGLDYALIINTIDEMNFKFQICMIPQAIICRSFQNSCNKINYSLDSVISEIEKNVNILRDLVEGREIEYSSFIGFKGLRLENTDKIELNGACIRQLDDISNPSLLTNQIATYHHSEENSYYSGCVLEIKHTTKLIEKQTFEDSIFYSGLGRACSEYQNSLKEKFEFAIVFTLDTDRAMQATSFENGFPLNNVGNLGFSFDKPYDTTIIKDSNIETLKEWFNKLNSIAIHKLKIPMERLRLAIFERFSLEDSILDALIAWEGIFSGRSAISFKIASSISKYIEYNNMSKEELFGKIKKLYNLRSSIVHGEGVFVSNETRSEIIQIGLECVKKLLDDPTLINMKPEKRVEYVVVFND